MDYSSRSWNLLEPEPGSDAGAPPADVGILVWKLQSDDVFFTQVNLSYKMNVKHINDQSDEEEERKSCHCTWNLQHSFH